MSPLVDLDIDNLSEDVARVIKWFALAGFVAGFVTGAGTALLIAKILGWHR